MRFRQKFLGFTGGMMVVFGLAMLVLGKDTAYLLEKNNLTDPDNPYVNGAAGVPMWTGIVIIMCGLANLIQGFEKKKKSGRSLYELPFSITVFFANFVALAASAICMGMLSWSILDKYLAPEITPNQFQQAVVSVYASIIVICCLIVLFALVAMFVDCCGVGLFGLGPFMPPVDPRESPYDTYNRPAMLYKP